MKDLQKELEKLVKEHGLEAVKEAIGRVHPDGNHSCDQGYFWDNVLHKCVPDIGG